MMATPRGPSTSSGGGGSPHGHCRPHEAQSTDVSLTRSPPHHHGEVIARATGSGDTRGLVTDPTPLGGVADHRVIPVPRPSSGAVGGALRWMDPSRSFLRA